MVDYCSVTRILLLRHGQSTWNAEGRWQGWADPPLSPLGELQTEQAADLFVGGVEAAVSSDLQRAKRTAEIFAARLGVGPVEAFPGLRERDVGDFTGLTRDEIDERWPGLLEPGTPLVPPGGETSATLLARAIASLHRLAELYPDRQVLAVTHGALIRTVEGHLGVEHGPTPNLAGRWVIVTGAGLAAGDRAALLPGDPAIVIG
jgi:probable phosphoglycerate mutase